MHDTQNTCDPVYLQTRRNSGDVCEEKRVKGNFMGQKQAAYLQDRGDLKGNKQGIDRSIDRSKDDAIRNRVAKASLAFRHGHEMVSTKLDPCLKSSSRLETSRYPSGFSRLRKFYGEIIFQLRGRRGESMEKVSGYICIRS